MPALSKGVRATTHVLALRETFQIARGAADEETVVTAEFEHDGIVARGEGAPVDYWGETIEGDDRRARGRRRGAARRRPVRGRGDLAADRGLGRAAGREDGARRRAVRLARASASASRLHRLLGTDRVTPPTSYTIGIDTVEGTADRTRRATGYEVLKIKVGGPGDLERLRAVREVTAARLRIDGNEGWDLATARELTPELIELGVEFVEQPFPAADLDAFHGYRELSPRLPVLIDEGCKDLASVAGIATYADGIVIKLSKCGGIREALRMIHAARALGLQVMLGCMIESELGIAQAAQLGSLADHIDLDGHLLVSSRPYTGLGLADGRLVLSESPGLGVEPAGG